MQSSVLNDLAEAKRRWTEKKLSLVRPRLHKPIEQDHRVDLSRSQSALSHTPGCMQASTLLAWFPASWASKIAPCFLEQQAGSQQGPHSGGPKQRQHWASPLTHARGPFKPYGSLTTNSAACRMSEPMCSQLFRETHRDTPCDPLEGPVNGLRAPSQPQLCCNGSEELCKFIFPGNCQFGPVAWCWQ